MIVDDGSIQWSPSLPAKANFLPETIKTLQPKKNQTLARTIEHSIVFFTQEKCCQQRK